MNFLAHVAVARGSGLESDQAALGAALPDLAGMIGVPLHRRPVPPAVADGIACHHACDQVFHGHPMFVDGSRSLRRALEGKGVASGPSRGAAHVGWELLLDGEIGRDAVEAFERAIDQSAEVLAPVMTGEEHARWTSLVAAVQSRQPWRRYRDPGYVASRVALALRARPRLALRDTDVPLVAGELARIRAHVAAVSATVVTEVTAAVRASGHEEPAVAGDDLADGERPCP